MNSTVPAPNLMMSQDDSFATPNNNDLPSADSLSTSFDTDSTLLNDDHISDVDSALGDLNSRVSSTASLTSECRKYPLRYGRTYHQYNDGKYLLPNDEAEQDRLDLQNELWRLTLADRLHLAPIGPNPIVLDIGTGTGIWALNFGDAYPEAVVIGVDLSPIQPLMVAPNVRFEITDAEDEWTYSQRFNYVHGRTLFTCFDDSKNVIRKAFESLDPGGYLELQDMVLPFESDDGTLNGTDVQKWVEDLINNAKIQQRDWTCASKYKEYMEDVGFVDVRQETFSWPINTWPRGRENKVRGIFCQTNLSDGLEAFSMSVFTNSGLSMEDVQAMLVNVTKDLKNQNIHAYIPVVVVYGQKPKWGGV